MTIQKAIELANKGGYKSGGKWLSGVHPHGMLLDPDFWSALGKAMGWKLDNCDMEFGAKKSTHCTHCHFGPNGDCNAWLWHWHFFIDHLADGESIESYFEKL